MSTKMKRCGVVRHKPVICKPARQCADETQGGEEGSGKKSVHGGKRYCFEGGETHTHERLVFARARLQLVEDVR